MFEQGVGMAGSPADAMPIGLLTGNRTIDLEHQELFAALKAARTICLDLKTHSSCAGCGEARHQQCEQALVDVLGNVLSFVLDHFKTEESIMRDSLLMMIDRELCQVHMEDHAGISAMVERMVSELDSTQTVSLVRELDQLLTRWIAQHIATHDVALVNWIEREDSALRTSF